jgi:tryptophan halogenase
MFAITSWVQVMLGQQIQPNKYHPVVDQLPDSELREYIGGVGKVIASCVDSMPTHAQFIARYCQASQH